MQFPHSPLVGQDVVGMLPASKDLTFHSEAELKRVSTIPHSQAPESLILIDSNVHELSSLLSTLPVKAEVYQLQSDDAIAEITQILATRTGLNSIHLISHGRAGNLRLGEIELSSTTLSAYAPQVRSWGNALSETGDLLLYGCDVAQGEIGQSFVQELAQMTGADIAASSDLTGSQTLGGDWELEVNTGKISVESLNFDDRYQALLTVSELLSSYYGPTTPPPTQGSNPNNLININGTLYFTATTEREGTELWMSNAQGTKLVKDIASGSNSSNPTNFVNVDGTLYFTTVDSYGTYLWKSDGTEEGTSRTNLSSLEKPQNFIYKNGFLYYTTTRYEAPTYYYNPGGYKTELLQYNPITQGWKSLDNRFSSLEKPAIANLNIIGNRLIYTAQKDPNSISLASIDLQSSYGSASSLKEFYSFNQSISVSEFVSTTTNLYFTVNTNQENSIWTVDLSSPNTPNTFRVVDFYLPQGSVNSPKISNLTEKGGYLYFTMTDTNVGHEIWEYNSTTKAKTAIDLAPGPQSSNLSHLVHLGGTLYFLSNNPEEGLKLWKVKNPDLQFPHSSPQAELIQTVSMAPVEGSLNFTKVNGALYFTSKSPQGNLQLWKSDGTPSGTQPITGPNEMQQVLSVAQFTDVNGRLYFVANDGRYGSEVWSSNGTPNGTDLVVDANSTKSLNIEAMTHVNGWVYFILSEANQGKSLWRTDNIKPAVRLHNLSDRAYYGPVEMTNIGSTLYFIGHSSSHGVELWKYDTVSGAASLVSDIAPGNMNSMPTNLRVMGDRLYFRATTPQAGTEAWISDGTAAGTRMLKDIQAEAGSSAPDQFVRVGNTTFFLAQNSGKTELWKTNDTPGTTALAVNFANLSTGPIQPIQLNHLNGNVFFMAKNAQNYYELWKSDGTDLGTQKVHTFTSDESTDKLFVFKNKLYFVVTRGSNPSNSSQSLWISDGTAAGTQYVNLGFWTQSIDASSLTIVNDKLYFVSTDKGSIDIWQLDGTNTFEGNKRLKSFSSYVSNNSTITGVNQLINANGTLHFLVNYREYYYQDRTELWRSDGTQPGTIKASDMNIPTSATNWLYARGFLFFTSHQGDRLNSFRVPVSGSPWELAATTDLDNDGYDDLLWRNLNTGEMRLMYTGYGGYTYDYSLPRLFDPEWFVVGSADFTNDGRRDIFWRNRSTGENLVWQMDGIRYQQEHIVTRVHDFNWTIAGFSQFSGTTSTDILWRNLSTGENAIWEMDGTKIARTYQIPKVQDLNWTIVGLGDFTNDGQTDIVWRNQVTGENVIWEMNNGQHRTGYHVPRVADFNWKLEGLADLDHDGQRDFLWRNLTTGQVVVWKMNGTTLRQSETIGMQTNPTLVVAGVIKHTSNRSSILWRKPGSYPEAHQWGLKPDATLEFDTFFGWLN